MKSLLFIILSFWTYPLFTGAQQLPQSLKPSIIQVSEKPALLPDLLTLKPGWWKYIESAQGETLQDRFYTLRIYLAESNATLSPKEQKIATPLVRRIVTNLEAFATLRRETVDVAPQPTVLLERYNIAQLLTLAEKLRNKKHELKETQSNRGILNSTIKDAQQYLDNLMVAYLKLPERAPQRVVQGLRIMATQSALAASREDLRLQQANASLLEKEQEQLQEEFDHARQRLSASPGDLNILVQEKDKAEKVVEAAYRKLLRAEANALGVSEETERAKAQFQLRTQSSTLAAVEEALARVQLERQNLEWQLTSLLLRVPEFDPQTVRSTLSQWEKEATELQNLFEHWTTNTQQEYNQITEALSLLGGDDSDSIKRERHQRHLKRSQETLVSLGRLHGALQITQVLVEISYEQLSKQQGFLMEWWGTLQTKTTSILMGEWLNKSLFTIGENPITALGLLTAILIVIASFWISKLVRWLLDQFGKKQTGLRKSSLYVLGRLLHYLIIATGIGISLSSLGLDFTNLALIAGALSVGIGFGLQAIFNNFVSGLILLLERPLKIGDFVELESGVRGEVKEINVRSTRITTRDNLDVLVPNSEFINGRVINWTLDDPSRRIHVPFGVAYSSDTNLLREVITEAAKGVEYTLKTKKNRQPNVWIRRFGESRLEFELIVWIRPAVAKLDQELQAEYLRMIEATLRQHRFVIPFPQRDLHVRSVFGNKDWKEF